MFDPQVWAAAPFALWSAVFFVLGCIFGSLLNVCIHRMPRGESIIYPPSHCPHCQYSIPWYLNIPLATWLVLRAKCAHCGAPISARYFWVELLTGLLFLGLWNRFGHYGAALPLVYCLVVSGLIAATFIDIEHFIIPDEITLGGIAAGFVLSAAVPQLHNGLLALRPDQRVPSRAQAIIQSALGIAAGAGIVYCILRVGKWLFGRQRFVYDNEEKIVFTETALQLPNQEMPYEEIFYRKSDQISFHARTLELPDRCYFDVDVRVSPEAIQIGAEQIPPESVPRMEALTRQLVVPREAMGLGDVKFMAAIGAFLGWPAVLFCLMISAVIGSAVGMILIALRRHAWSSRIPYGPYIALAAVLWIFGGKHLTALWLRGGLL